MEAENNQRFSIQSPALPSVHKTRPEIVSEECQQWSRLQVHQDTTLNLRWSNLSIKSLVEHLPTTRQYWGSLQSWQNHRVCSKNTRKASNPIHPICSLPSALISQINPWIELKTNGNVALAKVSKVDQQQLILIVIDKKLYSRAASEAEARRRIVHRLRNHYNISFLVVFYSSNRKLSPFSALWEPCHLRKGRCSMLERQLHMVIKAQAWQQQTKITTALLASNNQKAR